MEKGRYKCLFCDHLLHELKCTCNRQYNLSDQCLCPSRKHVIKFVSPSNSCKKCNTNNDVVMEEGTWWLFSSVKTWSFSGHLSSLRFYDFDDRCWKNILFVDMLYKFNFWQRDQTLQHYENFLYKKQQQINATRLEWLKCAKRIGRHLINKDVTRLIVNLLDKEPFIPICPAERKRNKRMKF